MGTLKVVAPAPVNSTDLIPYSGDPGPASSFSDVADDLLAYPKQTSECRPLFQGVVANVFHVFFDQFGVGESFCPSNTTSFACILRVFCLGSRPQMNRLDADGPVARVQDEGAIFGNGADEQPIGHMASANGVSPVHMKVGIASGIEWTGPVPAAFVGGITGHEPAEYFDFCQTRRSTGRPSGQRITMAQQTCVVSATQPSPTGGLETVGDEAQFCISKGGHR